jgi:hypothetical protein
VGGHSQRKKTKVLYIPSFFLVNFRGEYQMKKGDKGKKIFGVLVILAVIDLRLY